MNPFFEGIELSLTRSTERVLDLLEGIPEIDLVEWKPSGVSGEANTFAGLATHIAGSGEFWILEAAGGIDQHRQRSQEFVSEATIDRIAARYERWLADTNDVLNRLSEDDLSRLYIREAIPEQGQTGLELTVAGCLVHAVEHTAIHVGHLQIHRQLWEQDQA